jgi:cytochrome P450
MSATMAGAAREPPSTSLVDLLGLVARMIAGVIRSPRRFSVRLTFRDWAQRMMARYGSDNVVLNFGVKRILLVGGRDLSRSILDARPRQDGYAAGKLKHDAMAFLAPHALTISHDAEWTRLREFNERVLYRDLSPEVRQAFIASVARAFSAVPRNVDDVRAAMGRSMLAIVFGEGTVSERLVADIQALMGFVLNPVKRRVLGIVGRRRRTRFYRALREAWRRTTSSSPPSLLAVARRVAGDIPEEQVVEQIPHWMFTFTGSGTDLLARTLALVTSHRSALERARAELAAAGPLDSPETIDSLAYLDACLMEAARLYPPVTRTFHRVRRDTVAGTVHIPAGMEILHSLPLLGGATRADVRRFQPERWLTSTGPSPGGEFDPFLGGARRCPGKELILLVCKTALAVLLVSQRVTAAGGAFEGDELPAEFPMHAIRFEQA